MKCPIIYKEHKCHVPMFYPVVRLTQTRLHRIPRWRAVLVSTANSKVMHSLKSSISRPEFLPKSITRKPMTRHFLSWWQEWSFLASGLIAVHNRKINGSVKLLGFSEKNIYIKTQSQFWAWIITGQVHIAHWFDAMGNKKYRTVNDC